MIRIRRPNSAKVLILQHGICDSPYTWIANGCSNSLAYRAWDCGFDVFLTSFRGVTPRRHIDSDQKKYWNFSVDDLANMDLPSSIRKIRAIKMEELGHERADKVQYVFVGHSMGGMVLLMYLINCRLKGVPHHLSKAVLLSPAGCHMSSSFTLRSLCFVGGILGNLLSKVVVPETVSNFLLKLVEDFQQLPAMKSLVSFCGAKLVGGTYDPEVSPLSLNRRLYYNIMSYVSICSNHNC